MSQKKEYDQFGILITREMKAMLLDGSISFEDRAKLMVSIITGETLENAMMNAFADSLRTGFETTNNKRKAEILARRERQKGYQRTLRASTVDERTSTSSSVDISTVDECLSTEISIDERASLNKANQIKAKHNISPIPPEGAGRCPPEISIDDIFPESNEHARNELADRIEATEAFSHMRVNRRKLLRALNSVFPKNTGAEILDGIAKWTSAWASEGWQYAPGSIAKWIADGKFLEEPRSKPAPSVHEEIGVKEIV